MELIESLKGFKTYIVAIIFGLIVALDYLGYNVPEKQTVLELLAATGLVTLRAGIKK